LAGTEGAFSGLIFLFVEFIISDPTKMFLLSLQVSLGGDPLSSLQVFKKADCTLRVILIEPDSFVIAKFMDSLFLYLVASFFFFGRIFELPSLNLCLRPCKESIVTSGFYY
jgi:hypothetical protein